MKPSLDQVLERDGCWDPEWWARMGDRVKRDFVELAGDMAIGLLASVCECQSPIETLLGLHLYALNHRSHFADGGLFIVDPQYPVEVPGGPFQVDFFLVGRTPHGLEASLIVECDGHDYHERTKEQAERDKRRDRALKLAGYDVIHFTGREIWRDPARRAMEIRDQFRALLKPREGGRSRG